MSDFDDIMAAQDFDTDLFALKGAEDRGDGLYYVADLDDVSVYEIVVSKRVVLQVRVDNAATLAIPSDLAKHLHPQATLHPIVVGTPTGSVMLPTGGFAIKGKHHIDSMSVRSYVLPRLHRFLVLAYGIGI